MIKIVIETLGLSRPGAAKLAGDGLFYDVADKIPAVGTELRELNGLHPTVVDRVLGTPGTMALVEKIAESARGALAGYADKRHELVRVTIAGASGRHRPVVVAEAVAQYLRTGGVEVETDHHHIGLPALD